MSLFQCSKCGCVENSACSEGGYLMNHWVKDEDADPRIIKSYRDAVGIKDGEKFGDYCCVCSLIQYTASGQYAEFQESRRNKWHNHFTRNFLPIGEWETDGVGNLRNKKTGETDFKKYVLDSTKRKEQ